MEKRKIKFDILPPEKSAFAIETPPDIPKAHMLYLLSGVRGSGKSVAVSNFVRNLMEQKIFDRVLLITPTYWSNKEIWEPLNLNDDDIFEPSKTVIKSIRNILDEERRDWDKFERELKYWKEFEKLMNSNKPIWEINPESLITFFELGFFEITARPEWKYEIERPPRVYLIIDDCMGMEIYTHRSAGLIPFLIAHRHQAKGLGISVAMLVQSYCSTAGVARPIRENATLLSLHGKCKDENQRKKLHEEIGADVDLEQFDSMYDYATQKKFGFLTVDFNPKTPEQMFRSQFDEYLIPKNFDNPEENKKTNII